MDWSFIHQAMNTTPSATKPTTRLDRIQRVSGILRLTMFILLLLSAYSLASLYFGWPWIPGSASKLRIAVSANHVYGSFAEVPKDILPLLLVKWSLGFFCFLVMNSLFRLYQRGILFSAKNVFYIRFLGYYLILNWLVEYQIQGALHDMELYLTQLFVGLLIIFIAWIMDEGRKIQEEQELTV